MRYNKKIRISAVLATLLMMVSPLSVAQESFAQDGPDFSIGLDEVVAIIGGNESELGRFPSTVALLRVSPTQNLFQRQFCAGTAISDSHILTAAHCMFAAFGEMEPDELLIAGNFVDLLNDSPAEIGVAQIFVHPSYDNDVDLAEHDVAIIETRVPHNVPPITLFSGNARTLTNVDASIVGWGITQLPQFAGDSARFPSVLNEAKVPVTDFATCNEVYQRQLSAPHLCAGFAEGGIDSCQGDSGGPLMFDDGNKLIQIGVTSFGDGCAMPDAYGVYSNIEQYESFITRIVPPHSNGQPLFDSPQQFTVATSSDDDDDDDGVLGFGASDRSLLLLLVLGAALRVRRSRRFMGLAAAALISTGCVTDLPASTDDGSDTTSLRSVTVSDKSLGEGALVKTSSQHKDLPMFDGVALSEKRASVIASATARYGVEPVCTAVKVAPKNSKRADFYEHCEFVGFATEFEGGTIQLVAYHFMSGRVVQIDATLHGAAVAMAPMANELDSQLGESTFSVGETEPAVDGGAPLPQAVYHWSEPSIAYARLMTEAGADTESFLLSIQHPAFTDVIAQLPAL